MNVTLCMHTCVRQGLLDRARRLSSPKRDGGRKLQLTLADGAGAAVPTSAFLLEDALTPLAEIEPMPAQPIELRFDGGACMDVLACRRRALIAAFA